MISKPTIVDIDSILGHGLVKTIYILAGVDGNKTPDFALGCMLKIDNLKSPPTCFTVDQRLSVQPNRN